jgi:hypothetical protein
LALIAARFLLAVTPPEYARSMTSDQQPATSPTRQPRTILPGEPLSPAAQEALNRRSIEELQELADRANRRDR